MTELSNGSYQADVYVNGVLSSDGSSWQLGEEIIKPEYVIATKTYILVFYGVSAMEMLIPGRVA